MKVTKHANKRIRERCGVGKKSCDRMAEIALAQGLSAKEANGQLKRYMDALYFYNKSADNIRIYGGKAWIFNKENLITVLNVPSNLINQANTQTERKKKKLKNT